MRNIHAQILVADPSSTLRGLKHGCSRLRCVERGHVADPSSILRGLKRLGDCFEITLAVLRRRPFLDLVFRQPGRLPEQKEAGGAFYCEVGVV